ncbi:unnamed protein product [Phytophthora fragariaefolia]|uniref:Unnamed protein product n=1 Tax=Phytophthora fragariaefolia TaxID=1490495 RepID=A0A9W7CWT4_9STRA|nr:unnamed protein product [Phytophthora fragariaefolia]
MVGSYNAQQILRFPQKLEGSIAWNFQFTSTTTKYCSINLLVVQDESIKTMVTTLTCLLLGSPSEEPFCIQVDDQRIVDSVKDAIKAENPDIKCPNRKLKLYVAKKNDGAWINSSDPLLRKLKTGMDLAEIGLLTRDPIDTLASVREIFSEVSETHVIHILIKVPDSENSHSTAATLSVMPVFDEGWTYRWKEAFNKERVLPEALPPVADLESFFEGDLPVKIGVPESFYRWSQRFYCSERIFKPTNLEPCVTFLNEVGYRAIRSVTDGDTKATYISYWDDSIRNVLEFVLSGKSSRYTIEAPLDGGPATPDFVFVLDSVCVVRGEEEGPKPLVAESPRFRKFDQVPWRHDSTQIRAHRLNSYNILHTCPRVHLLLAVLNMSRLLQSIASLCPATGKDEYRVLSRSNGVEIFLEPTRVTKTFLPHKFFAASEQEVVYHVLDRKTVNSNRLLRSDHDKRRMIFAPRGIATKPANLKELFIAICGVLWGLRGLHAASWMHRDIRWSNVMKRNNESTSWFLIDFMDALLSPADSSSGAHLRRENHAPDIFDPNRNHTTAVDVWSVGYLIETSDVQGVDLGKITAFKDELMHSDPSRRPTAEAALQRIMELEKEYLQEIKTKKKETEQNTIAQKRAAEDSDTSPSSKEQRTA